MAKWRAVCYINQFFGQYGGEEAAGMGIAVREEAVGPAIQLERAMGGQADVVATIICGDNYIGERLEEATEQILALIRDYRPDFVVAGPAFTAGRYGVACGSVCAAVERELHIPALTGMCPENPGVELYRDRVYIIRTSGTARSMRTEMEKIAALAQKLLTGAEVGTPEEEGYLFRGRVRLARCRDRGAKRAVDMLLAKVGGAPFQTETPMLRFDVVEKAPPIRALDGATVALITDGGLYPAGNPDKMPFINSDRVAAYPIGTAGRLEAAGYCVLHRGYDNTFVLEDPNRLVPVDAMLTLEREGELGACYPYFLTTTGLNTSLQNSKKIAAEIIARLRRDHVDAALLTST